MSGYLVSCHGVSRTFGSGSRAVVAVHDATCEVTHRSRIAIVGPSGSGKSTLVHILAGLDDPTSGTVDRSSADGDGGPATVGVVFQGPSLLPALTAQENTALPLILGGSLHAEAQRVALEAMRRVGVHLVGNQLPEELSGGQAQRVAVARVLTMRPRLILADEPTGRLDRTSARGVLDVLLEAADELDAGLVVATHDPLVLARLQSCWRMRDGRLDVMPTSPEGTR